MENNNFYNQNQNPYANPNNQPYYQQGASPNAFAPQGPYYQQPPQENKSISAGEWLLTILVCNIPLIGLILLFIFAFSNDTNPSKRNWARAQLIIGLVITVIVIIYIIYIGSIFAAIFSMGSKL